MSTSPRGGELRPVRLTQIPLDLRLRAARSAARNTVLPDAKLPEDRLFMTLLGPRSSDDLVEAARNPSDRVYWITRAAFDRVLGGL